VMCWWRRPDAESTLLGRMSPTYFSQTMFLLYRAVVVQYVTEFVGPKKHHCRNEQVGARRPPTTPIQSTDPADQNSAAATMAENGALDARGTCSCSAGYQCI
jgi:hypothetical protein